MVADSHGRMEDAISELQRLLGEPLESVRERERTVFDRELAKLDSRLVLFGAGNFGRKALACLRSVGIEPLAYADSSELLRGSKIDGLTVLAPREAAERFGQSALFVVTIWSPGHRYTEIHDRLATLGCRKITCASSLRWKFADSLLPDYCQDLPHKVYERADAVLEGATVWADIFSREEYLRQVRWRMMGDLMGLSPPLPDQYFPADLFRLLPEEVFVDCGAFDGVTLRRFIARVPRFRHALALEPDPKSYRQLCQTIASLPEPSRVEAHCVALGPRRATVRFRATGTVQAAVSSEGDFEVEQVTLDELLSHLPPTFIKMDIEGAEYGAIQGARRVISKYEPLLAVCVYHTQSDLWRIPLMIRALAPRLSLYLRPHVEDGWDLVCYAVPPERVVSE